MQTGLGDKRVMITGGAGFVGSHVTEHLLDAGSDVCVVDNLFAGREEYVPDDVDFERVDIRSDRLGSVVREYDPEVLVHLAALHFIPYCNDNPEETFEVNVMGTRNVLDAVEDIDLDVAVFSSSAAVYPVDRAVHSETDPVGPADIYGRTKLIGEDLFELFHRRTGTPTVVARLFNVYGPRETNEHLIPTILSQLEDGSRVVKLGNLAPKRDYVHVSEVATGLGKLLETAEGFRTVNLGRGEAYSVREVVECVEEALGESIDIQQDPERVRENDRPHLEADLSRLAETVGWTPKIDLVTGLGTTINDWKEVGSMH